MNRNQMFDLSDYSEWAAEFVSKLLIGLFLLLLIGLLFMVACKTVGFLLTA